MRQPFIVIYYQTLYHSLKEVVLIPSLEHKCPLGMSELTKIKPLEGCKALQALLKEKSRITAIIAVWTWTSNCKIYRLIYFFASVACLYVKMEWKINNAHSSWVWSDKRHLEQSAPFPKMPERLWSTIHDYAWRNLSPPSRWAAVLPSCFFCIKLC